MKIIDSIQDVQDMARGATLLGTGGGGDPYIGELFIRNQMKKGRFPTIIDPSEVDDEAFIVSVFHLGAPPPFVEQLVSERIQLEILRRTEVLTGRKIDGLICVEIGGFNSTMPLAISAMTGIPAIDADGIGRAFPRMEMTAFSINGIRSTPTLLMDELGNEALINTENDRMCENVTRSICSTLGAHLTGAGYHMSGKQMKESAILGTVTQTLEIGRTIREAREAGEDIFEQLLASLNRRGRFARILFDGKIVDIVREIRNGWHWGKVTMRGLSNPDDELVIELQNEFSIARLNGGPVTMVPDLISVLDRESGEPRTAESLSYGQRLKVLGYSADPILRRPDSLKAVGPRCFGFDEDFLPIEELFQD